MICGRYGLMALAILAGAVLPAQTHAAGALAIGACGAYGYAIDFVGARQASAAALKRCHGKGCAVVLTMKRGCAAFAIDVANACGAHGYGSARSLARAQNTALQNCYKYGGKDCVIRAFVCDAKG
jgi:hypothetical protein